MENEINLGNKNSIDKFTQQEILKSLFSKFYLNSPNEILENNKNNKNNHIESIIQEENIPIIGIERNLISGNISQSQQILISNNNIDDNLNEINNQNNIQNLKDIMEKLINKDNKYVEFD